MNIMHTIIFIDRDLNIIIDNYKNLGTTRTIKFNLIVQLIWWMIFGLILLLLVAMF